MMLRFRDFLSFINNFELIFFLGNLNTLLELIAFARYVVPYYKSESKSTDINKSSNTTVDFDNTTTTDDENDNNENLEMSISVERLSLVLIRVKTSNTNENTEECFEKEQLKTATAERLATITLLGANFQSRESELYPFFTPSIIIYFIYSTHRI